MLLIKKALPWPRAGKFEITAPVDSMSRLPPIMALNNSRPVLNLTGSNSMPSLAQWPRCTPVHNWPVTASVST
jgi:hypothetical protein